MSKVKVDTLELLEFYGIKGLKVTPNEVIFCCPFHFDKRPSASMSRVNGLWLCFACDMQGTQVEFVEEIEQCTTQEAVKILTSINKPIKLSGSLKERIKRKFHRVINSTLDERVLDSYRFIHPYLLNRGFLKETIIKYQLGFDKETKRITIPIRDFNGRLVGIRGRDVTEKAGNKYYPIIKCQISNYLYEEHSAVGSERILFEGELAALRVRQFGFNNSIATYGSHLSRKQAERLFVVADKIYLAFDNDKAGIVSMRNIIKLFPNKNIKIVELNQDIDNMRKGEFEEALDSSIYGFLWLRKLKENQHIDTF